MTNFVKSAAVQSLLDRASGVDGPGGNQRLKSIMRDLLEGLMAVVEKHDISESEFWLTLDFLAKASPEFGLIAPGIGIEHFLDLHMDEKDAQAGRTGGTPRTIEGPLYVAGAPILEGDVSKTNAVELSQDPDDTETLTMSGRVCGLSDEAVKDAILHVWHANSQGFYSHFDPTGQQTAFNNRRRILLGPDGRYRFSSKMPRGYSCPPGGATEKLMQLLGRHGDRPAHVHFFIEAPGYRSLTTQINFGDDPRARDDFAFGTREGLLPVPDRSSGTPVIEFDFTLQRSTSEKDQSFSERPRAHA
jgi:catechol 1,2-dioxygenase